MTRERLGGARVVSRVALAFAEVGAPLALLLRFTSH
jgi:hypothetical protein